MKRYNYEKTAIGNKNPTPIVRYFIERKRGSISKNALILDFGCGRGRNTNYLREEGYEVIAYDPYPNKNIDVYDLITDFEEIERLESVEVIILTYVLNTLPKDERLKVYKQIEKIPYWDLLLITVRGHEIDRLATEKGWELVEKTDLILGSGYVTKHNTFQKGYDYHELMLEIRKNLKSKFVAIYPYVNSQRRVEVIVSTR